MFGMPGVSITLNPILNYSTVIISYVVPGKADSVSKTGSCALCFVVPSLFFLYSLCCFINMALIKDDLPELVVPMT